MKLNFKLIILIVSVIIVSWVGNIYIFNKYSLDKPLLLKAYLNLPLTENYKFQLNYISNIYDKDNICIVSFPEISTQPFYINLTSQDNINNSNYRINRIDIDIGTIFLEDGSRLIDISDPEKVIIKKIQLKTLSQNIYDYDLGEIHLYKEHQIKGNSIKQLSSMSSNNNSGNTIFQANEEIIITEIVNPMKDLLSQVCDVEINGTPLGSIDLPLSFKSGDSIEVKYQFKDDSEMNPQQKFANFFIPLIFKGRDSKGSLAMTKVYINSDAQYKVTMKDIRSMEKIGKHK